jgi:hypothetical protein
VSQLYEALNVGNEVMPPDLFGTLFRLTAPILFELCVIHAM